MQSSSAHSIIRQVTGFAELLSLGFATIGIGGTLRAIGAQLLDQQFHPTAHPQRAAA